MQRMLSGTHRRWRRGRVPVRHEGAEARQCGIPAVTDDFPTNETCSAGISRPLGRDDGGSRISLCNCLPFAGRRRRDRSRLAITPLRADELRPCAPRRGRGHARPFRSHRTSVHRASCAGALTSVGRCSDMISQEWEARGREALTCRLGSGSENRRRYRARCFRAGRLRMRRVRRWFRLRPFRRWRPRRRGFGAWRFFRRAPVSDARAVRSGRAPFQPVGASSGPGSPASARMRGSIASVATEMSATRWRRTASPSRFASAARMARWASLAMRS